MSCWSACRCPSPQQRDSCRVFRRDMSAARRYPPLLVDARSMLTRWRLRTLAGREGTPSAPLPEILSSEGRWRLGSPGARRELDRAEGTRSVRVWPVHGESSAHIAVWLKMPTRNPVAESRA